MDEQIRLWLRSFFQPNERGVQHIINHQLPISPIECRDEQGKAEAPKFTSDFDKRNGRLAGGSTAHKAMDMRCRVSNENIALDAMLAGRVLFAGTYNEASGGAPFIGSDNLTLVSLAHAERFAVSTGQDVQRGQRLATMGDTGHVSAKGVNVAHVVEKQLPLMIGNKVSFEMWSYHHFAKPDDGSIPGTPRHSGYMREEFRQALIQYLRTPDKDMRAMLHAQIDEFGRDLARAQTPAEQSRIQRQLNVSSAFLIHLEGNPRDPANYPPHPKQEVQLPANAPFAEVISHISQKDFIKIPTRMGWEMTPTKGERAPTNSRAMEDYDPVKEMARLAIAKQTPRPVPAASKDWEWTSPSTWPATRTVTGVLAAVGDYLPSPSTWFASEPRSSILRITLPPARPAEPGHGLPHVPRPAKPQERQ